MHAPILTSVWLTQLVYGLFMLEGHVDEHPGVTGTFWGPGDFILAGPWAQPLGLDLCMGIRLNLVTVPSH